MSSVTLKKLVKDYRGEGKALFQAVKSIDLEVQDREFMVLVGPSGCGKSTTLRMIAGLEEVTKGTISIGDRVVNQVQPKDRDIAMVFQNYALYPHMSVFDNMAFGLKLKKYSKTEIRKRVQEAAEILGLESLLERKPKALSGGQRQRVAVGRAIVRKPKVFLFDEPLSNLDAKMRVSMRTEITKLHAQLDATMIYVTHDQIEAMTMGDRICVMQGGTIMQVDEPLRLYNNPKNMFVAGFIGSPPMNFFHGKLKRDSSSLRFIENNSTHQPFSITFTTSDSAVVQGYAEREIVLGIRPEDIAIYPQTAGPDSKNCVHARVDVAEPMGSETYVYLDTEAHNFTARVHSDQRFVMNQMIQVQFNANKLKFFDPDTEQVID